MCTVQLIFSSMAWLIIDYSSLIQKTENILQRSYKQTHTHTDREKKWSGWKIEQNVDKWPIKGVCENGENESYWYTIYDSGLK